MSRGDHPRATRRAEELGRLRAQAHEAVAELRAEHAGDRAELTAAHDAEWAAKRREQARGRADLRREPDPDPDERRIARAELAEDHREERGWLREDQSIERREMRQERAIALRELAEDLVGDIRHEFPESKTGRPRGEGEARDATDLAPERPVLGRAGPGIPRAAQADIPRRATHKASTAEAILARCLRRRGWTARYAAGRLTGRQHLTLLDDVRQYGRAWLAHEAGSLFMAYGDVGNARAIPGGRSGSIPAGHEGGRAEEGHDPAGRLAGMDDPGAPARSLGARLGSAIARTFDRMRSFVRELIHAGALALKGSPLIDAEAALLDDRAKVQDEYLNRFESEVLSNPPAVLIDPAALQSTTTLVQAPPMGVARFTVRAQQYASSSHQAAQAVVRKAVAAAPIAAGGGAEERRVLGHPRTHHCDDCPPLAELGWQPAGTLPDIGQTECGGLCLCHFEFRSGPTGQPTVNGKATLKRKRVEPPTIQPVPDLPDRPSDAEIDAEVRKWLKGEPSRLTIRPTARRPPEVPMDVPAGYTYEEAE